MLQRIIAVFVLLHLSIYSWSQELEKVELLYAEEGVLYERAKGSPEVFLCNILITWDELFLDEFEALFKTLKKADASKYGFFSIIVIPHWKNKAPVDSIYMGENDNIRYNGKTMEDNDMFLNLIKHKIGWKNTYKPFLYVVPEDE